MDNKMIKSDWDKIYDACQQFLRLTEDDSMFAHHLRQVLYEGNKLNIKLKAIKDSLEPLKGILNGSKSKGLWILADEYSKPTYLDGLNEVIEIIEVHDGLNKVIEIIEVNLNDEKEDFFY